MPEEIETASSLTLHFGETPLEARVIAPEYIIAAKAQRGRPKDHKDILQLSMVIANQGMKLDLSKVKAVLTVPEYARLYDVMADQGIIQALRGGPSILPYKY